MTNGAVKAGVQGLPLHLMLLPLIVQGRRKWVRRLRNCAHNIWLDCNFHKLLEEKRILKPVKN